MARTDFLVHDKADTVGVAVVDDIQPNTMVTGWIMETDDTITLRDAQVLFGSVDRGGHITATIMAAGFGAARFRRDKKSSDQEIVDAH